MQTSDSQPEGSGPAMTQQEQQEFAARSQEAFAWMQAVQEESRANDNTAGPRDASEARLKETEKIHHSVPKGQLIVDQVSMAAENLSQSGDEESRNSTNAKSKESKSMWEETTTYIVHCHSRIEWVWLHWSEYSKAYEEFESWLTKQRRSLGLSVESQSGSKEKSWQVDQQRVMVSDVKSQVALLERLSDEAAASHNRTQDPSVDAQAQQRSQEDYGDVRDRAEERSTSSKKISDEHHMFHTQVQKFQSWLVSKTRESTESMNSDETPENKSKALTTSDGSVACEEKTSQHIEAVADSVRTNTSPAGAETVQEEAEESRSGWQRLRQGLCEAEEGLRCSLDSHSQYVTRCQRSGEEIGRIRESSQDSDQESEDTEESKSSTTTTEEKMEGQWRKYSGVRNTSAGNESQVESSKSQLKDLFRFSEDSRHLKDDVSAVVKEHQSVKSRASRLCSESELESRSILQDPSSNCSQWASSVSKVIEASNNVSDFSNTAMSSQKIQGLSQNSAESQERLSSSQVKGDSSESVFGAERSDDLQGESSKAIRTRESSHNRSSERQNRSQSLISRTKDFDETYKLILGKSSTFRERSSAADVSQPDISAKKSQSDQMQILRKESEDGQAQLNASETSVSSSQTSRTQYDKSCADWTELHRRVVVKVKDCEEIVSDHESLHGDLSNMEKWMMVMRQKSESFCSSTGEWSVEGRQPEAQRLSGEFPEKEIQQQQIEVQGGKVSKRTSTDGQVHIQKDMERLQQRWTDSHCLSSNSNRLSDKSAHFGYGTSERLGSIKAAVDHPDSCQTDGIRPRFSGGDKEDKIITILPGQEDSWGSGDLNQIRWSQFEAWSSGEEEVSMKVTDTNSNDLSAEQGRTRQETSQALKSRSPKGQELFTLSIKQTESNEDVDETSEDLRYRWMLYKSKSKDVGGSFIMTKPGLEKVKGDSNAAVYETRTEKKVKGDSNAAVYVTRTEKKAGSSSRICRWALLLWLLFLASSLLAFSSPLMDDGNSCSLSNNFARSFSVMSRYDGPPPT